jgi:hypothetical protein
MTDTTEETAQRIAGRGRDALLERLRPAFEEAARAHADVLPLSDETLEEMVQQAADRADGLQWRRALATVATEELGIGLGEALGHPAVVRAHEIIAAPSYEESLTAAAQPATVTETAAAAEPAEPAAAIEATPPATPEPEQPEPELQRPEEQARAKPERPELEMAEPPPPEPEPEQLPEPDETPEALRFSAVHRGGVADLAAGARDIALHLSEEGLDIVRGNGTEEILGRLRWDEIRALEVPASRGARRRRREQNAHLVVRTASGEASFEVPAVTPEELRRHLDPLVRRYARG